MFVKTFEFECPKDYKLKLAYKFVLEPVDPLPIKLKVRWIKMILLKFLKLKFFKKNQ